jgi:BMFP domain-containing protein YqiC
LEPNIRKMLKGGRGRQNRLQTKIAKITEKFDGDTQQVRSQLLTDLKTLFETANTKATETTNPKQWKQRLQWLKTSAYLSQVINSISKTYDIAQIKTELEQLRKRIGEIENNDNTTDATRNQTT